MSTVTNPLSGLIEGLLQGHAIAQQMHQQQQQDQAFKTQQILQNQKISADQVMQQMQDMTNRQYLQEHARPVSSFGTVENPAVPGGPSPLAGVAGMSAMPDNPGMPAYQRKADKSRLVKYTDGSQYELKTPEEEQQTALNRQVSSNNTLEDAKANADAARAQTMRKSELALSPGGGLTAPAGWESQGWNAGDKLTRGEYAKATAGEQALAEGAQKIEGQKQTARKTGIEADELQRKLDSARNTTPDDYNKLVDQIAPPDIKGNGALNLRTKALIAMALHQGKPELAQEAIKNASAEVRSLEVATDPRVAANKVSIALQTGEAKTAAMGLTEDDYRREGEKYAITGVMPPMGMGSNGRGKIMHYAQEFARSSGLSPRDLATAQASFAGDKASLAKFQTQRDQIVSFEQTAQKNLDLFINAASKIPDSGSPWLNLPLRQLNEKLVGSANMAAVNAARQVANNEIAKVTSGGGLGGVLSDSARREVMEYNPKDATLKQTLAVAQVLKQDMANRHQSMDATLGEIRGRIGQPGMNPAAGAAAPPPAAGGLPQGGGHVIQVNGKNYSYNGTGATDDMKNYTAVK